MLFKSRSVGATNPAQPFLRAISNLVLFVAQFDLPAWGIIHFARHQVPVPKAVCRAAGCKRIALFADSQGRFGALTSYLGAYPRERYREIDRLGDIVVGPEVQRLGDRLAVGYRRDHDDRQLVGGVDRSEQF